MGTVDNGEVTTSVVDTGIGGIESKFQRPIALIDQGASLSSHCMQFLLSFLLSSRMLQLLFWCCAQRCAVEIRACIARRAVEIRAHRCADHGPPWQASAT